MGQPGEGAASIQTPRLPTLFPTLPFVERIFMPFDFGRRSCTKISAILRGGVIHECLQYYSRDFYGEKAIARGFLKGLFSLENKFLSVEKKYDYRSI